MCEGTLYVQSRTRGVHRCHLCQIASYGLVNRRVCVRKRKLSVQGNMGPLIFAYTAIVSPLDPVPRNVRSLTKCVQLFQLCQSASQVLVTGVCIFQIINLVYKALRDLPGSGTQLVAPVSAKVPQMYRAEQQLY